jgi:16S rRNA (adenine1518-N6/adenine1519-N6)-dimethyltransferase
VQRLSEIREILRSGNLRPQRRFGQNFLIDGNLMIKLLELADLKGDQSVLEVGAATGSLTEELLVRASRVVAVEIDKGLCEQWKRRLGDKENFVLISGDVLASKHAISPAVLDALGGRADMVANLPYNIAVPLLAECLICSWRALKNPEQGNVCRFERLTFTVQKEVALRLAARPPSSDYGPISVLMTLLGEIHMGPGVPPSAFWPRPKVASQIMRIDFSPEAAGRIENIDVLTTVLHLGFGERRKQIGSIVRRKDAPFTATALGDALESAGIDRTRRPEQIAPDAFVAAANYLARSD